MSVHPLHPIQTLNLHLKGAMLAVASSTLSAA